ncbi:Endonuclease/exonuclease/phosphatase [Trichoderma compactum]
MKARVIHTVTDIKGLVTAPNSNGVFLRSTEPDENPATSEGLFVFNSAAAKTVKVGDVITLDGLVVEYRSNANYIYLTEINKPTNIEIVSSENEVKPLVIGLDTSFSPTKDFSSLDQRGIFGVPNAPDLYGLDFWESLSGEYVTIKDAYQISRPNTFGDVYIRGNWPVTGLNAHGGLTMLEGDANPEVITIGTPLDGSKNPLDTRMGDYLGDITGVVSNDFGSYQVQDNSGNKNDGIVDANVTLSTLASKIEEASGIVYDFVEISPINNKDGGEPGGNIHQAYFYCSDVLQLYKPNLGGSLDVNEVLDDPELIPPLVAMWKTVKGTKKTFFTINVRLVSKGGSTSLSGDLRPPVNQGVEERTSQTRIVAEFVAEILSQDPTANILVAGDFNEYSQVDPLTTFSSISSLTDLDQVVGIDPVERYTYLFDMNTEELDHMYVSEGLHRRQV